MTVDVITVTTQPVCDGENIYLPGSLESSASALPMEAVPENNNIYLPGSSESSALAASSEAVPGEDDILLPVSLEEPAPVVLEVPISPDEVAPVPSVETAVPVAVPAGPKFVSLFSVTAADGAVIPESFALASHGWKYRPVYAAGVTVSDDDFAVGPELEASVAVVRGKCTMYKPTAAEWTPDATKTDQRQYPRVVRVSARNSDDGGGADAGGRTAESSVRRVRVASVHLKKGRMEVSS